MNGTQASATVTTNPKAILRYIDDRTAQSVHDTIGHKPHGLDMVASTDDGRIFVLVNHGGKIYLEEGRGASYTHSIEVAYRSFLNRIQAPVTTDCDNQHPPGYGHEV